MHLPPTSGIAHVNLMHDVQPAQTALQTKHRELEEVQERHTTKEQRIGDLQHQLEGESRALAAARNDLHTASAAWWSLPRTCKLTTALDTLMSAHEELSVEHPSLSEAGRLGP
jgi:chromosome segregation ATPase